MSATPKATQNSRPERALCPGWFFTPSLTCVRIGGAPEWLLRRKFLFITDVHLRRHVSDARLEALVNQIAAVGADMLLLGGDYAESPRDCRRFFRALSKLNFPLGAFAVLGNNDDRSRGELRRIAADAGVTLLVNETRRIELPGGALTVGGCDEYKYGSPRTQGLFANDGSYRVLLSHFPIAPGCACDLMLSGHTHAGQICPFGLTPYSLPFERKYHLMAVHGLRQIGDMQLLVSGGVGVSRLPLRLNAEPEIHLIEFGN